MSNLHKITDAWGKSPSHGIYFQPFSNMDEDIDGTLYSLSELTNEYPNRWPSVEQCSFVIYSLRLFEIRHIPLQKAIQKLSKEVLNSIRFNKTFLIFDVCEEPIHPLEQTISDDDESRPYYSILQACAIWGIPYNKIILCLGNLRSVSSLKNKVYWIPFHVVEWNFFERYVSRQCNENYSINQLRHLNYENFLSGPRIPWISLNRRCRWHRCLSAFLFSRNKKNVQSFLMVEPYIFDRTKKILENYSEWELLEEFEEWISTLPLEIDEEASVNAAYDDMRNHIFVNIDNLDLLNKACMQLVNETRPQGKNNNLFITEKTFKPIAREQPFLVYGPWKIHEELENLGYVLYDSWFNYDFDNEEDEIIRCKKLHQEVSRVYNLIESLSYKRRRKCRDDLKDKLEHNIHHLYNTKNYQRPLIELLDKLEIQINSKHMI